MSDIHALSGAYAVDAVDEVERARFERHLVECPSCRAEVDSLREAAATLPATTAVDPPPALRARVLAEIATVRPLPPLGPTSSPGAGRRRRLLPTLVAAAVVIGAVGVGLGVTQPWEDEPTTQAPSAAERVRNAPDAQEWTQEFPDGSAATLIRSESLNEAVVVTEDMAEPADGKVYELWLQHDDVMVPAGLMPEGPDNVVVLEGDPASASAFGITIEPEGGSDAPTSAPLTTIEFDET